MTADASPSVEISIAMLSWINEQLRETAQEAEACRTPLLAWAPSAVTLLACGLCGFCVAILQGWT